MNVIARSRHVLGLTCAVFLSGCAVGPDYEEPRPPMPQSWNSLDEPREGQGSLATPSTVDIPEWWQSFKDPQLSSLVDRALAANLDLKAAAGRLREARAFRRAAVGSLLPEVGTSGSYQRLRLSENGTIPFDSKPLNLYEAG